jgi:hypothetical protein
MRSSTACAAGGRGWRVAVLAGFGLLVPVALTACGGSNLAAVNTTQPTPATPSTATTTTTTTPTYTHTWTINSIDSSGATWTTTVATGPLVSGNAMASAVSPSLFAQCDVNTQTDAIVPWELTTTSTTSGGFTTLAPQLIDIVNSALGQTAVGTDVTGSDGTESPAGYAAGETLSAGEGFSTPACPNVDPGDNGNPGQNNASINISSTNPLSDGGRTVTDGFFVLQKWASPNSPSGDAAWLGNIWILIPQAMTFTSGNPWETTSVTGPGALDLNGFTLPATYSSQYSIGNGRPGYGWAFPVDGTSAPDCADAQNPLASQVSIEQLCAQQSQG